MEGAGADSHGSFVFLLPPYWSVFEAIQQTQQLFGVVRYKKAEFLK